MEIRFEQAEVRFGEKIALHRLTLLLTESRIGIIGLNGSGKTTFARMINGLVKPTRGKVTVNGKDTTDAKGALDDIGFIFQSPQNQIILPIVREDIGLGLKARGVTKSEIDTRTDAVLRRFGAQSLGDRRAHELSGGELQIAAFCSVLVTEPDLLILDEPTNQLDLKNRERVANIISSLPENIMVISHDLELIADFERVLVFDQGRLAADAPGRDAVKIYRGIALA